MDEIIAKLKEAARLNKRQWGAGEEGGSLRTEVRQAHDGSATSCSAS